MRTAIVLLIGVLLSACAAYRANVERYEREYIVPVGSRLVLQRPLEVKADSRDVLIQNGEVPPSFWALDQYYPYCELVLRHLRPHKRVLEPSVFEVYEVEQIIDDTAARGTHRLAGVNANGAGPTNELYAIELWLRSDRYPDVQKMVCGSLQDPTLAEYPTIDEVRKALHGLFVLELAPRG